MESLRDYFTETDGFEIKSAAAGSQISIYHNDALCVKITLDSDPATAAIHIDNINKCFPSGYLGSGSYNIEKLKKFARDNQYKLIIDSDVSKKYGFSIDGKNVSGVSLGGLYILSKGQSWYNSMGFLDNDYVAVYQKTLDYINDNKTQFKFAAKIKTDVSEHLPAINDDIKFINEKHTIKEIFEKVTNILDYLLRSGEELNPEQLLVKKYLLEQFSKKIDTLIKEMTKARIFLFHEKFFDLVYDGAAESRRINTEQGSKSRRRGGRRQRRRRTRKMRY